MWLNGIHPQTDAKPTAKTLMGSALEYSLDPLGDQSFYYSAVRSHVDLSRPGTGSAAVLVGASPDAGHIWINRPDNWSNFVVDLEAVLDAVATPPPAVRRFHALARTVSNIMGVSDAYDIALVPPELLTDLEVDPVTRELATRWAYTAQFAITATNGLSATASVHLGSVYIGTVDVHVVSTGDQVTVSLNWADSPVGQESERQECESVLANPQWLKIYYESGHTIAQGRCFLTSYQDQPFTWRFEAMAGFDVATEKPALLPGRSLADCIGELKANGQPDDSLFSYILNVMFPHGWLASDDGAMEFADFVHIDDASHTVTLVHAKAARSGDLNRQVSASLYEVVVGQAVKNLRHLVNTTLEQELTRGRNDQIARAVWHNGVRQPDRAGIIARAQQLPSNHPRRVIILQPQLTRQEHDLCRSGQATPTRLLKMHQLDTLMLAAELSAKAVGATLTGWSAA
ncbi:hypothetical protein [Paraburkholderia sp. GAS32]|uniref:hypothetical protein n=1 Tax=Paraburkholderia sp. GAS32 TaxID=3035129 RepID=UPI003D200848